MQISFTHLLVSLLFVPILFEKNHQSPWWSTRLMLVFCNQAQSHMTTDQKSVRARPMRPPLPTST